MYDRNYTKRKGNRIDEISKKSMEQDDRVSADHYNLFGDIYSASSGGRSAGGKYDGWIGILGE